MTASTAHHGHSPHRRGFTLIELLVVISILALLVAMLTPYLTKAREIAKRAMCLQYQRNIAQAILGFANTHNGRAVGSGAYTYSGLGLRDILNTEWYRATTIAIGIWPNDWPAPKNQIVCPSAKFYGGRWCVSPYVYNMDCDGASTSNDPNNITYGQALDPTLLQSFYPTGTQGPLYRYHLGTRLEMFKQPGLADMMIECENEMWGDSVAGGKAPVLNGNANAGIPPWSAMEDPSGHPCFYGFRHCLPPDVSLYQQQATACFSFVDGHVEIVFPTADLDRPERFYLNPRHPRSNTQWD